MKYRVRLTLRAERDVDDVLTWFITQHATTAAAKWHEQFLAAIATLEQMPQRCGPAVEAAEIDQDVRELHIGKRQGKYRILFRLESRSVLILHVRHAARDAPAENDF